jgi:hypothetical protein
MYSLAKANMHSKHGMYLRARELDKAEFERLACQHIIVEGFSRHRQHSDDRCQTRHDRSSNALSVHAGGCTMDLDQGSNSNNNGRIGCKNEMNSIGRMVGSLLDSPVVVMSSGLRGTSNSSGGVSLRTFFSRTGELVLFLLELVLIVLLSALVGKESSTSESLGLPDALEPSFICC